MPVEGSRLFPNRKKKEELISLYMYQASRDKANTCEMLLFGFCRLSRRSSSDSSYLIPIKKIPCSYILFHAACFFYFFLSCYPRLEGAVGGEEPLPLLSCASHFR